MALGILKQKGTLILEFTIVFFRKISLRLFIYELSGSVVTFNASQISLYRYLAVFVIRD